jgi:integrase
MPILGETGCRLAEVVGLRVEDIDLERSVLNIRPHALRRLKTAGSERSLPLLGCAEEAVRKALMASDGAWLFPQYFSPEGFLATHASNALNKWLKSKFDGLTAHSLRHTMRDRLRAVECPLEAIDQIGGWSSVSGVGTKYGKGYGLEHIREWMKKVEVCKASLGSEQALQAVTTDVFVSAVQDKTNNNRP